MSIKRSRIIVEGRVQGVGYRMFVRDLAAMYHLTGWVKNLADGTVEVMIEGEEKMVNEMTEAMQARDSYVIRVDRLISTKETPIGETVFEIRR